MPDTYNGIKLTLYGIIARVANGDMTRAEGLTAAHALYAQEDFKGLAKRQRYQLIYYFQGAIDALTLAKII
jgi:hypothetical protein